MTTGGFPRGPDVSNHQRIVAWESVASAGHVFGFAKATEGTYYRDPYFAGNWTGMKAAKLSRGAYHFARPSSGTPDAEAQVFLDAVARAGGLETSDMLVLDIEDEHATNGGAYGSVGAWSLGFCQYIEEAAGFKPLVYTGAWYTATHDFGSVPDLAEYGLWLAAYQGTMPRPPAPWSVVAFWQYTSSGRVPGVNGDCDVNLFNGDASRIAFYGKPGHIVDPEYTVGAGILAEMTAHGDVPACNEVFFKSADGRDEWSEAVGNSGARYIWLPSTSRVFRYDPAT